MESARHLLSRLPYLEIVQLREQWFLHFNSDVGNKMSAKLLRLAIAYRVQELESDAENRCDAIRQIAEEHLRTPEANGHGYAQHLKPGTRLLRDYKGKTHEVLAVQNGLFVYEGTIFKSLSEVACRIVGRRRAGTIFFGLRGKRRHDENG